MADPTLSGPITFEEGALLCAHMTQALLCLLKLSSYSLCTVNRQTGIQKEMKIELVLIHPPSLDSSLEKSSPVLVSAAHILEKSSPLVFWLLLRKTVFVLGNTKNSHICLPLPLLLPPQPHTHTHIHSPFGMHLFLGFLVWR